MEAFLAARRRLRSRDCRGVALHLCALWRYGGAQIDGDADAGAGDRAIDAKRDCFRRRCRPWNPPGPQGGNRGPDSARLALPHGSSTTDGLAVDGALVRIRDRWSDVSLIFPCLSSAHSRVAVPTGSSVARLEAPSHLLLWSHQYRGVDAVLFAFSVPLVVNENHAERVGWRGNLLDGQRHRGVDLRGRAYPGREKPDAADTPGSNGRAAADRTCRPGLRLSDLETGH